MKASRQMAKYCRTPVTGYMRAKIIFLFYLVVYYLKLVCNLSLFFSTLWAENISILLSLILLIMLLLYHVADGVFYNHIITIIIILSTRSSFSFVWLVEHNVLFVIYEAQSKCACVCVSECERQREIALHVLQQLDVLYAPLVSLKTQRNGETAWRSSHSSCLFCSVCPSLLPLLLVCEKSRNTLTCVRVRAARWVYLFEIRNKYFWTSLKTVEFFLEIFELCLKK